MAVYDDLAVDDSSTDIVCVAATGTRADGSFALPVPPRLDDQVRTIIVESQGGFRVLRSGDGPTGTARDIVLQSVRALPLAITLPEPPPGEGTLVSMVIDHGGEGENETWALHALVLPAGRLGSRSLMDSSGGLLSVSSDGRVLRATVLVPVGEVRIGVTLDRSRPPALTARSAEAAPYGTMINDLDLRVSVGEGPISERSLSVPHPDAASVEVVYRPARSEESCLRWSVHLRRVGGILRFLDWGSVRENGRTHRRLVSVPPGAYQIGAHPGCRETVHVRPGRSQTITLRRPCAVSCLRGHPFCGVGSQTPPR